MSVEVASPDIITAEILGSPIRIITASLCLCFGVETLIALLLHAETILVSVN